MKQLDRENWLQPDPAIVPFVRWSPNDGSTRRLSGEDWASAILSLELSDGVPTEVRRLFEVARGALVYGYFYYPLYTLGTEQLFRVAQSAVTEECRKLGKSFRSHSFMGSVDFLIECGRILPEERTRWDALRHLRNMASHPEDQTIFPPSVAVGELRRIASSIDALFVDNRQSASGAAES